MKQIAFVVLNIVLINLSLSCGPTDRSKLNFREEVTDKASGNSQKESPNDYNLTDAGYPEFILPMHTINGMKDSAKAALAYSWTKPMALWVRYRISMSPFIRKIKSTYNESTYEYLMRLNKHKAESELDPTYPYYIVPVASDYYRDVCPVDSSGVCQCTSEQLTNFEKFPKQLYLDPVIAKNLLKDPKVKGLYIHELMAFSNNEVPKDNKFNCPKKKGNPILWSILKEYAAAAAEFDKQIIWNDAGDEGAWKWLLDALKSDKSISAYDRAGAQSLFKDYSKVIVPLWANNRNTLDAHEKDPCHKRADAQSTVKRERPFCDKIDRSIAAVKAISNYPNLDQKEFPGRFGASIQDWHTMHTFVTPTNAAKNSQFQECVRRDIISYTAKAQREGSKVFEFESYWASEGFFKALNALKDPIRDGKQIPFFTPSTDQACFPAPPEEKKK